LSKETAKFSKEIVNSLEKITKQDEFDPTYHNDLKKFYETLPGAQSKVQDYKQDWQEFETGVDSLVDSLKSYSEFDIVDGATMKNFLAENIVMNYSNIEIHKILFQQMMNGAKAQQRDLANRGRSQTAAEGTAVRSSSMDGSSINRGDESGQSQNISFNRNSQLAMANNFAQTGIRMVNRPQTAP
jgi:hypothetical protein